MSDYLNAKTENVQKLIDNCLKKQKQVLIAELKEWYLITTGETSELMEVGERYKHVFYALQDRIIELGKKIKKWEGKD